MLGGISIWQIAIILVIVILIFGTKKLRTLGSDLGGAVKGFKKAMNEEQGDTTTAPAKNDEKAAIDQKSDAQMKENLNDSNIEKNKAN